MNEYRQESKEDKALIYDKGKIWFTRQGERKIFFVMTLMMLVLGILSKMGLF